MLTYTFSKREKVLLFIMAVVLLGILWYQFVYVGVQTQVTNIENQISEVEDQIVVKQSKSLQLTKMQSTIDEYKAKGATKANVPAYDNQKSIMAQLNAILGGTDNYSLKFEDVKTNDAGLYERGVTLTFSCGTYEVAESTLLAIRNGAYPCSFDSASITSSTSNKAGGILGSGNSANAASAYTVNAHVVFYEK